jgi:oligopeptidase B
VILGTIPVKLVLVLALFLISAACALHRDADTGAPGPSPPRAKKVPRRLEPNDESVPFKLDDYWYYSRFEKEKNYPILCRKKGTLEAPEEIMLDANVLAEGHEFFSLRGTQVSSGQDILAFSTDTVGRKFYTVRFKNLVTEQILSDEIPDVTGNLAWAEDNRTVFYAKQDPETLRSFRIYRHVLGEDPADDDLVYEETDDTYSCRVFKTKSKKYVMIASNTTLADEYRYLEASEPNGEFEIFLPRERGHEYSLDHYADRFYVRTNDGAKNFRLMFTPVSATDKESWTEVVPHRDDVYLGGFEIFRDHLVVTEREAGLIQLHVIPWSGDGDHYLQFDEPAYVAYIDTNLDFDTTVLRFGYASMATPGSIYDYDMVTRERTLLKRDQVLGGYDPSDYTTERVLATARDGAKIPVSLVHRKDLAKDGRSPLFLHAYGSYGYSMNAGFDPARVSLLDRGFVFAIAHVRGGQEMGRQWYEDGKLLKKKMDVSIPLTTSEYDEWGDPNEKEYYDYILSYSPYDNVEVEDYPNLLVTTGLYDSQVQYWEPAKWVAKLRAMKIGDGLLLLKTNMETGHHGTAGRLLRYRDTALVMAFLFRLEGISE